MDKLLKQYLNQDHLFIICPNELKKGILNDLYVEKKILDIKFMDINEYKHNYFFDYDIPAIKYLMDAYSLSVQNAKEILQNLIYVDTNKTYNNEKLDNLVCYKKQLEEKQLLNYNPLFKDFMKTRNVLVFGYDNLNELEKRSILGNTVTYLQNEPLYKKYTIHEFKDIEKEVEFVYNSIFDLLEKGVDINNIYLMNVNDDYETYINRYNTCYPFKVKMNSKDTLIGLKTIQDFLPYLLKSKTEVKEYLNTIDDHSLYSKIVSVLNKYTEYEYREVIELIKDDFKNTKVSTIHFKDAIRCIDFFDEVKQNDHVFVLGFHDGFIKNKIDTDYITDNIAPIVLKNTSEIENKNNKNSLKTYLSKIENIVISYHELSPFGKYEVSTLLKDYTIVHPEESFSYSERLNRIKYGFNLEKLLKYNDQDKKIMGMLYENYGRNDFLSYSNSFNHLTLKQKEELKKVTLSYSSMDNFSKCSFKYYLMHILGLNDYKDTFYTKYGTLCHDVLKDFYQDSDFEFDTNFENKIKEYENKNQLSFYSDEMEKFFIEIIKEELRQDIAILKNYKENSLLDTFLCENEFRVDLNEDLSFVGFIDKLMYKEMDDKAVVTIVDYKTGSSAKFEKKLVPYGLSLQLPVYMWLLLHDNKINKKIEFAGIYIQHLLNTNRKYDVDETLQDYKKESALLEGISTNDKARLAMLDLTFEEGRSEMIQSIALKKDGEFKATSKVISDVEFDRYIEEVDATIMNSFKAIQDGEFKINPKQIDKENKSCDYCPFMNICYRKDNDLVIINTSKEEQ